MIERIKALNQIEFFRHGKNYLVGNFMVQGLAFLSIPILTRILAPDDYGLIAVFVSIVSIFSILLGLNFHGSISRKYYEEDDSFGEFIYSTTRFVLIFALLGVGLSISFAQVISDFFQAPRIIFLLALGVSFLSIFPSMYLFYLQASMQSRKYAIISFVQSLTILLLSIVLILNLSEDHYLGKIIAQVAVAVIIFFYSLFQLRKLEKRKWNFQQIKYAINLGIPLIPHTLSYFILSSFDRIIINQLKDATQTGLYSLAYNVGSLLMIVIGALNNAWVPILFKNLNEKRYLEIQKKSDVYALIIILCAFWLALFSREMVMAMASPDYYAALHIIPVIVLSSVFIFLYQLCVNYTFYVKKNIWISINTLLCGGLNIGLNYLYIPKYGYKAAAWTTLVSYFLLFVLNYITAWHFMRKRLMNFSFKLALLAGTIGYFLLTVKASEMARSFWSNLFIRVGAGMFYVLAIYLLLNILPSSRDNCQQTNRD